MVHKAGSRGTDVARRLRSMVQTALPLLFAAGAALADPSVDNITVRQRWPWNGKVDVDYVLVAATNCDVRLKATTSSYPEPIVFSSDIVEGQVVSAAPGANHFVWDPADSGLSGRLLANFEVTADSVESVADRTYLVLDLVNGGYEFASAPPPESEGGWTNTVYKQTKMVFRRVPAGTYTLGCTAAALTKLNATGNNAASLMAERTVTVSTDYYIALFVMTDAQKNAIYGSTPGTLYSAGQLAYETLRGCPTNGVDSIIWPKTGHRVADGSCIKKLRDKARLPSGMVIDLPTEAQWEIASRAGTATIFPAGGTPEDDVQTLLGYLGQTTVTNDSRNAVVASKSPNAWGIYDPIGIYWELVLENCNNTSANVTKVHAVPSSGFRDPARDVDPIGRILEYDGTFWAITCNSGYVDRPTTLSAEMSPSYRAVRDSKVKNAVCFCIHLRPLVK